MGTICPKCQTHQAFIRHLTKNQEAARKSTDVIGHRLACGHDVGGETFTAFQNEVQSLEIKKARAMQAIEEKFREEMQGAWVRVSKSSSKELTN